MHHQSLKSLDVEGKAGLVRLDLNVPLHNGKITDDTRIIEALPTLQYLLDRTHKLVVMSHLGRPKQAETKK